MSALELYGTGKAESEPKSDNSPLLIYMFVYS